MEHAACSAITGPVQPLSNVLKRLSLIHLGKMLQWQQHILQVPGCIRLQIALVWHNLYVKAASQQRNMQLSSGQPQARVPGKKRHCSSLQQNKTSSSSYNNHDD
jgi:hypothetical protein